MSVRGQALQSSSRKVVHNVMLYMTHLAEYGPNGLPTDVLDRTAMATGVPAKTVQKILYENIDPKQRQSRRIVKERVIRTLSKADKMIVKKCIYDHFYIAESVIPTLKQLYTKVKEDKYPGGLVNLKRTLRDFGFIRLRLNKSRSVIIENPKLQAERIMFMKRIDQYRAEGRSIVYTNESVIGYVPVPTDTSNTYRTGPQQIILEHAVSNEGYIPNSLNLFQKTTTKAHYNTYLRWMRTLVVPNIPPNSVVVITNGAINKQLEDYVVTLTSKRTDMERWLRKRNIPFSAEMVKPDLYKLISSHPDHKMQFKVDSLIEEAGHEVLRLSHFYSDLNPLTSIFEDITKLLKDTIDNSLNYTELKEFITAKYGTMSPIEYKILLQQIKKVENKYRNITDIVDKLTDEIADQLEADNEQDEPMDSDNEETWLEIAEEKVDIKYEPCKSEDPLS